MFTALAELNDNLIKADRNSSNTCKNCYSILCCGRLRAKMFQRNKKVQEESIPLHTRDDTAEVSFEKRFCSKRAWEWFVRYLTLLLFVFMLALATDALQWNLSCSLVSQQTCEASKNKFPPKMK
jgi:hypothetical protein